MSVAETELRFNTLRKRTGFYLYKTLIDDHYIIIHKSVYCASPKFVINALSSG